MPQFRFRYVRVETGKLNTARKRAFDEDHLREIAAEAGMSGLQDIVAEPEEDATERQIAYMRELGISVTGEVNIREASDLITNKQKRQAPGGDYERGLARHYRVEVTRFASKASIYENIASTLGARNQLRPLVGWYVYRVYRNGADRTASGLISTPAHPSIGRVADQVFADAACVKSIQRELQMADGWRWFGTYRAPDGNEYQGASTKTSAYRSTVAALLAAGLIPAEKPSVRSVPARRPATFSSEPDQHPERPRPRSWWQRLFGG